MSSFWKAFLALLLAAGVTLLFPTLATAQAPSVDARAQGPADLSAASSVADADPLPQNPAPQKDASADTGDGWRGQIAVYGWFAGVHGTVGALGKDAYVRAPFSDLFHYLKGVIPVAVEADKGRFVMPIDYLWMRLGDDRGIPLNEVGQTSVNIHITQSILTPKFGYRLVDTDHWKIDALAGIRYWYLGQSLALEPSGIGNSQSANWVDGLGGTRIQLVLSPKASIMVSGDAGGGGANLDYQVIGLLNYKFGQHLGLGLGWRYLDVNYRGNHQFIYDTATSGALAGFYYTLGGKPPVPPTASCSVSPTEIWSGDPVTATMSTQNFNPKHTITYAWTASGGKISGTGTTGNVDTTGLAPGSYTAKGTATDEKEKKNNIASCEGSFTVKQPHPPVADCSASPNTVKAGEASTLTVNASSPDNFPLTYAWSASAGRVNGTGANVSLDTTGAPEGAAITTAATVTDSRGLSTSCSATVNVLSPPVTVAEVQEIGECKFMDAKRPSRVDNTCKAILDDVALRIQHEPNGKFVVVGFTDEQETVTETQLGAQRSVNMKYYLVNGEGGQQIDATRIDVRTSGTMKEKGAKIYFVPSGATFTQESVAVDETQVKGQGRNAPAPKKKAKKAPAQTPPAQ